MVPSLACSLYHLQPLCVFGAHREQVWVTFERICFLIPCLTALRDKDLCPMSIICRLPLQGHFFQGWRSSPLGPLAGALPCTSEKSTKAPCEVQGGVAGKEGMPLPQPFTPAMKRVLNEM